VAEWLSAARRGKQPVSRNVVAAGLVLLELMREKFPLTAADYATDGQQIKEIKKLVRRALERHGETRTYSSELGRTSRSTIGHAHKLAERLNKLTSLQAFDARSRARLAEELQRPLVAIITDFLNRSGIEIALPDDVPISQVVAEILRAAGE